MHNILSKRNGYYQDIDDKLKKKFLNRLVKFISKKTFIIKDDEAFKEMPVLVSASAIQLTFGLKQYLLPFYKYIRIFPEEYFGDNSFKILAGNVQGNTISIAWNHFLKGYENEKDGSNVGMHEMGHALYFQKLVIEENYAKRFTTQYNHLMTECSEAHAHEVAERKNLYSSYANQNLDEFWAESVELFFEKPAELQDMYPEIFKAMSLLLNQNTLNSVTPILLQKRFAKFWLVSMPVLSQQIFYSKQATRFHYTR